jgi:Zn ribbon nucleic-acid-binding protein
MGKHRGTFRAAMQKAREEKVQEFLSRWVCKECGDEQQLWQESPGVYVAECVRCSWLEKGEGAILGQSDGFGGVRVTIRELHPA